MFYMLKKPCVAKRKDSKVRTKSRSNRIWQEVTVAEGSLWYLKKLSSEVQKSLARSTCKEATPPTPTSISISSYEYEGTILQCGVEVVIPLQDQEYTIFQAIRQPSQRTQIYYDAEWLRDIKSISLLDPVYVEAHSLQKSPQHQFAKSKNHILKYATLPSHAASNTSLNSTGSSNGGTRPRDTMTAVVKYIGPIPTAHGTWYGVELVEDDIGRGMHSGSIREKTLFKCNVDCAMIVPPNRIRSRNHQPQLQHHQTHHQPQHHNQLQNHQTHHQPQHHHHQQPQQNGSEFVAMISPSRREADLPLQINERVVWLSDNGAEAGVVKWLGYLSEVKGKHRHENGDVDRELTAGVEFDKPVGTGDGVYHEVRLFQAKLKHASLLPLIGLIREKEFLGDSQSNQNTTYEDCIDGHYDNYSTNSNIYQNEVALPNTNRVQRHSPFQPSSHHQYTPSPTSRSGPTSSPSSTAPAPASTFATSTPNAHSTPYHASTAPSQAPPQLHPQPPSTVEVVGHHQAPQKHHSASNTKTIKRNTITEYKSLKNCTVDNRPGAYASKTLPSKKSGQYGLELDSMVEIANNTMDYCKYGIIRWIGQLPNHPNTMAALEMEEESSYFNDGTYLDKRYLRTAPHRSLFVPVVELRRDSRLLDSYEPCSTGGAIVANTIARGQRRESQAFGDAPCPEIRGHIAPPVAVSDLSAYVGRYKGIQGHHNSCYLDTMLYSMFAFTTAFDSILYRQRRPDDITEYDTVQTVLRDCIVNPLRKNHYVRADKIMKLRRLLDKLGNVQGLTTDEKDPEEFLSSLLEQIMRADSFIKLNSGQKSYFYTLFLEKSHHVIMPTTQQLLSLSFLQSNVRLLEVPPCLILQMPVGSDYRMYRRIIPSLTLDVTDILYDSPRECSVCEDLATRECLQCYTNHTSDLRQTAYCDTCCTKCHGKRDNSSHKTTKLKINENYLKYVKRRQKSSDVSTRIARETMQLFAIVCIRNSHYTAFVRCPLASQGSNSADCRWIYFDSMAERVGGPEGYNVPETVAHQESLHAWLTPDPNSRPPRYARISSIAKDSDLPEAVRRCICDTYFCMYENTTVARYT